MTAYVQEVTPPHWLYQKSIVVFRFFNFILCCERSSYNHDIACIYDIFH